MSEPISMLVPATLIAVASLPLAFKLVPPNRFYGVRTSVTLANRGIWFRANQIAGLLLMLAVAVSLTVYYLNPELASGRSFPGVLILVLPVLLALAVTSIYIRGLSKRRH